MQVGDRVRMDTTPNAGWLGTTNPDLGEGTVVCTDDEFLMAGLYVEVEWDEDHGTLARRPSIQSLVKVG